MPVINKQTTAFAPPGKALRNSAKALIINEGLILCTKNKDLLGDYYLLPGGGQEHGETLLDAVIRECREEIGARIEVGHLYFVREYISANHELASFDASIHQIEFMFLCRLLDQPGSLGSFSPDAMQTGIEWLPIAQLTEFRFYPTSLIEPLKSFPPADFARVYLGDTL